MWMFVYRCPVLANPFKWDIGLVHRQIDHKYQCSMLGHLVIHMASIQEE